MGYDISLYTQYAVQRQLSGTERWDVERAAEEIERVFKPAVTGERRVG